MKKSILYALVFIVQMSTAFSYKSNHSDHEKLLKKFKELQLKKAAKWQPFLFTQYLLIGSYNDISIEVFKQYLCSSSIDRSCNPFLNFHSICISFSLIVFGDFSLRRFSF